nr:alpha/beta hydrolase [Candidatus Sigynarchaeota archaeon]
MKNPEKVRRIILIIFTIIFIALECVTIWPITGLYGSRLDWWGGNSTIRATSIAVFGAPLGTIGLVVTLHFLFKQPITMTVGYLFRQKKVLRGVQVCAITAGILLTCLCMPYFAIPVQIGQNARQEFAETWGSDWESQIAAPSSGPWLGTPYSLGIYYTGLPYDRSTITKTLDVEFFQTGNDSFTFDVFEPAASDGPFPAIICIHGGGWCGFDKNTIFEYQREYLAAAGYVVFTVQYGASQESERTRQFSMQEIMDNLAHFSDWLAVPANTAQYKVDLAHCFVNGLSAGGHLSALVTVARYNVSAWNPAVNVVGGIDFYGITDIRHWVQINQNWLNASGLFNASVLTDFTVVDPFSPITYIADEDSNVSHVAPLLIFHGDVDSVVNVSQSRQLDALCDARGLKCIYIEISRGEHVFEGNSREAGAQISLWAIERFLKLCLSQ